MFLLEAFKKSKTPVSYLVCGRYEHLPWAALKRGVTEQKEQRAGRSQSCYLLFQLAAIVPSAQWNPLQGTPCSRESLHRRRYGGGSKATAAKALPLGEPRRVMSFLGSRERGGAANFMIWPLPPIPCPVKAPTGEEMGAAARSQSGCHQHHLHFLL